MMICYSPITTCSRNVIHIKRHLVNHLHGLAAKRSYKFSCYSLFSGLSKTDYAGFGVSISNRVSSLPDKGLCGGSLLINRSTVGLKEKLEVSFLSQDAKMKCSEINSNMKNLYWYSRFAYTGVVVSLLVCYSSTSQSAYADASRDGNSSSDGKVHNGKRVYTDYSIIGKCPNIYYLLILVYCQTFVESENDIAFVGIPGDGRCLFRSVAHGFCLRSGNLAPGEKMQRELADELRTRVSTYSCNQKSN